MAAMQRLPAMPGATDAVRWRTLAVIAAGWLLLMATWAAQPTNLRTVQPRPIDFRLQINTAPVNDLTALPGVGPALAAAIDARRRTVGPFESRDDLFSVKGMGDVKVTRIEPWVAFDRQHSE